MRTVAQDYKAYQLIPPTLAKGASYTTTAGYIAVTPGEEADAIAIVNIGAIQGAPTSTGVTVTISGSATNGGALTTLATITTPSYPTAGSTVVNGQLATKDFQFNGALYGYLQASATVVQTSGTTPSLSFGVTVLTRQTVGTSSNESSLT